MRPFALSVLFVATAALTGCGGEERLYDVSGTVTTDGKPVNKGLIFFDPDGSKGTTGLQGFANIVDGKFTTAVKGKGVRGGHYNVRVNGFDGKEGPEAPFGAALFPEYITTKELPAANSTYDLDVPKPSRKK